MKKAIDLRRPLTDMAAFYQERGIDAGAMEDWRNKANEDLPFIIYHFSFVISEERNPFPLQLCGSSLKWQMRNGKWRIQLEVQL
jgi:hypothetical protein